jgi:hypothetical protein
LPSFFYQDYVFHAHVLSSLIPALNAYFDDQDCDGACHLKNYSFVITYLLEDEQELSLGMLIRPKRIYNFLCSMLVFTSFALCFVTLCGIFFRFSELTWNWMKQVPEVLFFPEEYRGPNESQRGARGQPHHEGARPSPWPRPLW